MKKAVRILLLLLAALLVIVLGYVAYVFIAYHRIPDHQALDVRPGESAGETVRAELEYRLRRLRGRLQLFHGRRLGKLGVEPGTFE